MTTFKAMTLASSALTVVGATPVLDDKTLVPVGLMVAGVLLAGRVVWRVSRMLNALENDIKTIKTRLNQLDRRKDPTRKGEGGSNP